MSKPELYQVSCLTRTETIHAACAMKVDERFLRKHCQGIADAEIAALEEQAVHLIAGDSLKVSFRKVYERLDLETAMLMKLRTGGLLMRMAA